MIELGPANGVDASGSTDVAPIINNIIQVTQGKAKLVPLAGGTYLLNSLSPNGLSALLPLSGLTIEGESQSARFLLGPGVNTPQNYWNILFNNDPNGMNDVSFSNFTIEFGPNNAPAFTGAQPFSCALGCEYGKNISVERVKVLNNPGTTGFKFGFGRAYPPAVNGLRVISNYFENAGSAVNPNNVDHSSIWATAGGVIAYNWLQNGGTGTGIEAHGEMLLTIGNIVLGYAELIHLANECDVINGQTVGTPSYQLSAIANMAKGASIGITGFAKAPADLRAIMSALNNIALDPNTAACGIDFATQVSPQSNPVNLLNCMNMISAFGLSPSAPSTFEGIRLGAFRAEMSDHNLIWNTQGPAIHRMGTAMAGSLVKMDDNMIVNPGLSNPGHIDAISSDASTENPSLLSASGNMVSGPVRHAIAGATSVYSGQLFDNQADDALAGKYGWTGTGIATRG